jgi:hypothetical protein
MFLLDGLKFNPDIQHTIGDTQYPPGWLLDPAERVKLDIIEVPNIPRPDPALYDSTENPDGTWTSIPKLPPTPEEVAAEALRVADEAAFTVAKVNPIIAYLTRHTPAECAAKVQSDVTNLATAKDMLAHFAVALCVLSKEKLR